MMKKLLFALLLGTCATLHAQGTGAVCGEIFNDLNGDGVLNAGEPGISGISIWMIAAPMSEEQVAVTTDASGQFCFTGLDNGLYTFNIDVPGGFTIAGNNNTFSVEITDGNSPNPFRFAFTGTAGAGQYQAALFSAYPNPAAYILILQANAPFAEAGIVLFDLYGKQVLSQKITGAQPQIDISNLAAGVYVARVVSDGKAGCIKVVVER